ncbi:MAG: esterase/lipase family protein [Planctomycetota bacterium]|jgi:pimeloyl-ACP methyl ester carboxylesterase
MKKPLVQSLVLCLLLLGVGLSMTGCAAPYSVKRVGATKVYGKRTNTPLNSNKASFITEQYLRLHFLTDEYESDPVALIEQLHNESFTSNNIEVTLALTELALLEGRKHEKNNPFLSKAMYLTASEGAWRYLLERKNADYTVVALDPTFRFMAEIYKQAVSSLWSVDDNSRPPESTDTGTFETATTLYRFTIEESTPPRISPEAFDELIPANQFQISGLRNEYFSYGIGTPLMGIVNNPHDNKEWGPFFTPQQFVYPVTGLLRFEKPTEQDGKRQVNCTFGLYDPLATDSFLLNNSPVPLEANFTTALAFQLQHTKPLERGLAGLIKSDKLVDNAGLYLLEPYRPDKIPVVMVHGLMSSPTTWVPMFNDLRGQPDLRERYQFWFFSYPTGLPILYSSSILRRELNQIRDYYDPERTNRNFDKMVLVGHSMGGLLSRMMLIDSGDTIYQAIFDEPFDELPVSDNSRELIESILFFKRQDSIRRVIFISTPHRGSPLADTWYAKLGTGFVNLPGNLVPERS